MKLAFDPQISRIQSTPENDEKSAGKDAALKRLCQDFEALFINSMFQQMRKTIPTDGYLEHDMSMDFFEEIMDTEVAAKMSRQGGFGLAQRLYEDFQKKPGSE